MIQNLQSLFQQDKHRTIAAFNVYGYEDAKAVLSAAEELSVPVILMVNRDAAEHMPIRLIGPLLRRMAEDASIPACVHLDHAVSLDAIRCACENQFTSVMFDGSQLPVEENIEITRQVVALAHPLHISVEAEIGSVGYDEPSRTVKGILTEPEDARYFYDQTQVNCLAVSVGTVHRQTKQTAVIQYDRLLQIMQAVDVPLVIHGSSSVSDDDLTQLAQAGVRKINLGTCLRMAFGNTLRETIANTQEFDRIKLFGPSIEAARQSALKKMRLLNPSL